MTDIINLKRFLLTAVIISGIGLMGIACKKEVTNKKETLKDRAYLLAGEVQAVAYSGFRDGQHPDRGDGAVVPSSEEILEDLQILSKDGNFNLIRLYDSQENSQDVLQVIADNNLNIKVMLGAWLNAEVSNHEGCPWLTEPIPQETLDANKIKNKEELGNAIRLANTYKDIIVAVNVGNEALVEWNDHMVTVDSVISYVQQVKKAIEQPVTVADNFKWWALNGRELAKEVDFLGVHTYALWEGKGIAEGMSYTINNMKEVADSIQGKKMAILEAGWATTASEFGERASEEKQDRYFNEMMDWAKTIGMTVFFFEAFDENWKGNPDNPLGAEKHWGIFRADRTAKKVMHDLYPERVPELK